MTEHESGKDHAKYLADEKKKDKENKKPKEKIKSPILR